MAELVILCSSLTTFAGVVGVIAGLWVWANAVARKRASRFYRGARWLPRVGAALLGMSVLVIVVSLARSFNAVAETDAASKATALGRGISMAMNGGAGLGVIATLLFAVSSIISLAGTLTDTTSGGDD